MLLGAIYFKGKDTVPGNDFNNAVECGVYNISNLANNKPEKWNYGVVLVMKTAYLDIIQVAFSTQSYGIAIRYKPSANDWTSWVILQKMS